MSTPDYNQGYQDGQMGISRGGSYNYEQGRQAAAREKNASLVGLAPTFPDYTNPKPTAGGGGGLRVAPYNWAALGKGLVLGTVLGIVGALFGFYVGFRLAHSTNLSVYGRYALAIATSFGSAGFALGLVFFRRIFVALVVFCAGWLLVHTWYPNISMVVIVETFLQGRR